MLVRLTTNFVSLEDGYNQCLIVKEDHDATVKIIAEALYRATFANNAPKFKLELLENGVAFLQ